MNNAGRTRALFFVEAAVAALLGCLTVLTLAWRDWIEGIFGVDPDRHSGSLEWLIVVALAVSFVVLTIVARREWRRLASTS